METKDLFRKKAVDRVSNPEQLNDYIHVTSPSIWLLLAGIICILLGAIVWGIFGNIYSTLNTAGSVHDHTLTIYVSTADRQNVKVGMDITVNGTKTQVREISEQPVYVTADMGDFLLERAGLTANDWAYKVEADTELEDGVYEASITTEVIHPIEFVIH